MRPSLILYTVLVSFPIFAQTDTLKIVGASEPPEFTGAPKKGIKLSNADTELFELIGHLKNEDETKATLPKLDDFIARHPDYSDAQFLRATCKACILKIFKGMPNFSDSTNRWRTLCRTADQEDYFLDVKSAEFPGDGPVRIWLKFVGKKETQTVENELDCKTKRMKRASIVTYDSNGTVLTSSEVSSGWQGIVPDTIGEQLYNGACRSAR